MGFIISILGGIGSLVLVPVGFAVGIYVPLVITDTAYQLYNVIGMSNFARQLFGSTNGIGINWASPFVKFFLIAVCIGIAGFVLSLGFQAMKVWYAKGSPKATTSLSKLSFGMLAIVLVPIGFMLSVTITSIIFNALSGNDSSAMISSQDRDKFVTVIFRYKEIMADIFEKSGKISGSEVDWNTGLNEINSIISQLKDYAQQKQYSTIVSECENIQKIIAECKDKCSSEVVLQYIDKIIACAKEMIIGQRLTDISELQNAYDGLYQSEMCFSSLITSLEQLSKSRTLIQSDTSGIEIWNKIFVNQDSVMNYLRFKGESTGTPQDFKYSIYNLFSNYTSDFGTNTKNTYYSTIQQILCGCDTKEIGKKYYYWCVDKEIFGSETINWIGIDVFYQRANPWAKFKLSNTINGFVLGTDIPNSNYNIVSYAMSACGSLFSGHLERMVVGSMCANMLMATMMCYAYYIIGRVLELIILWLGAIIVAFRCEEEGTQFKIMIKAIWNKTLSIIFVQFVFTLVTLLINIDFIKMITNSISSSDSSWFNAGTAIGILGTTIVFSCGYYLSGQLCTLILGEAGQLRSFGDQYHNLRSSQDRRYGHKTDQLAKGANTHMFGIMKDGHRSYADWKKAKRERIK